MKQSTVVKMCSSKIRYPSKGAAMKAAERHAGKWKSSYRPYRCPFCNGGWHLTKDVA